MLVDLTRRRSHAREPLLTPHRPAQMQPDALNVSAAAACPCTGPNPPPTAAEWEKARELLARQGELREALSEQMRLYPLSGLYNDEERREDTLAIFVAQLRSALADSPRSVLLRALDARLAALAAAAPDVAALHGVLRVPAAPLLPIISLADAVAAVPRGAVHHQWSLADAAAQKAESPLDDPVKRRRAVEGFRKKRAAKRLPPPTDADLEAMFARAATAAASATAAARARAATLRVQLDADAEWARHQRAHALWASSGAAALWKEYEELDFAEGRERMSRGGAFEAQSASLCFAMLVERLRRQHGGLHHGAPREDFWYRRGAVWMDRRGKQLGEIDLVVGRGGHVCALLEMKAGCFEVCAGLYQHEPKAAAVATGAPYRGEDGSVHDGVCIAEAGGYGSPRLPLLPKTSPAGAAEVPVFVATLLPPHAFVIGAEPALTRAVCAVLFGRPRPAEGAMAAAAALPIREVEASVRARMGPERLGLSPLGCLRQRSDCVLVVEVPPAAAVGVELDARNRLIEGARSAMRHFG